MQELKCPKCGEVFYVDEQGYAQLASQIRDKEFEKELKRREEELNEKKDSELQIVRLQEEKKQEEKIKKEMKQWQETVAMITNNRKIEKNKRLKQYDDEYRLSVDKIQRKKDMDVAEIRREIANLEESIAKSTEELNRLSIFKFRRKEELRNNIESYKKTIREYMVQILSLENKAQKDISAAEKKYEKKVECLEVELDKEFVIPENPEEIERKKREQARKEAIIRDCFDALYCDIEDLHVATKKSVETKIVFDALDCVDKPVTVTELSRCNFEVGLMSPSSILSYLQALVNEGIVEKSKEGKANKYMVSSDCSKKKK